MIEGNVIGIYMRKNIINLIDDLVFENKELYKSRSQVINSATYKFLRDKGKVPEMEVLT